ncbi:MAG: tryptophanyl-tRNA synthetase [Parcubacteria group bacterium Gr01-1014_30]|nr:MAG: tryptophanyl-tRNA synthetase [Parcubacteria group bacterium Gr01-1014_30]
MGAISQFVQLQEKAECIFSIVDLHAITVPYNPQELSKNIFDAAVCYLASGIDPEKSILFVQSWIKEHTELAWLLSTVTPTGDLLRMTQYKEKSKQLRDAKAGLLNYPILMASDILLYKAEAVPVGQDQKQHLELTRTVAKAFNSRFGETFPVPRVILRESGDKIMALNNPKKKMSKTAPSGCLYLFEEPEAIKKKVMASVTDSGKKVKYDLEKKPGISNLLTIYSLFSGKPIKELEKKFKNSNYSSFKKSLAEQLIVSLEPFRRKKKELLTREVYVREVLRQGAKRAKVIAASTMAEVRQKMGLA